MAIVLGLAIGATLLCSALGIQKSLERVVSEEAQELGGSADLLAIPVLRQGFSLAERRSVEREDGVQTMVPVVKAPVIATVDGERRRILLIGVTPQLGALFPAELGVAGTQIGHLRQGMALTSAAVRERMGGDRLLVFGGGRSLDTRELAATPFQRLNGGLFALSTIAQVKELVPQRSRTEFLYIAADPGASISSLKNELEVGLAGRALVVTPSAISQLYQGPIKALALFTEFGALVSLPILLFVVFTVSSRAIAERRRELALLATLGATRLQLGLTLLCSTAALGCVGGLAGIWLSTWIGEFILRRATASYPLLPAFSDPSLVTSLLDAAAVLVVTMSIAVAAALPPVRRGVSSRIATAANPASPDPGSGSQTGQIRLRWLAVAWLCCAITIAFLLAAGTSLGSVRLALVVVVGVTMAISALPLLTRLGVGAAVAFCGRRPVGMPSLAARNLERNRSRTTAMVGALGLAAALGLGMGLALSAVEGRVTQVFENRYGPPLYVTSSSFSGLTSEQPLSGRWAKALKKVRGVEDVFPFRIRVLPAGPRLMIVVSAPMIREINAGFSNAVVDTDGKREEILRGLRRGGVVVSKWTLRAHDLRVGDRLAIGSSLTAAAPPVVGVYEDILGADALYMERSTYIHLSEDGGVDRFAIAPVPGSSLTALRARLRDFVAHHRVPAVVEDRAQVVNAVLESPRQAFALGRTLVAALFLVAGMIVFHAVFTSVRERRWELAVCRAIGMTKFQVVQELVLQCLIVGIIAALLAAAMGVAVAALLTDLIQARLGLSVGLDLEWQVLTAASFGPLVVAAGAALLPAAFAVRREIVPSVKEI